MFLYGGGHGILTTNRKFQLFLGNGTLLIENGYHFTEYPLQNIVNIL